MKDDGEDSEGDITNTKTLLDICKIEHNKMRVLQDKETENNSTVTISGQETNLKGSHDFGDDKKEKITVLDEQGIELKHKKDKLSEISNSLERFNIREQSKLKLFDPQGLKTASGSAQDSSQRSEIQKFTKINSPTLVKGIQSTRNKVNMQ